LWRHVRVGVAGFAIVAARLGPERSPTPKVGVHRGQGADSVNRRPAGGGRALNRAEGGDWLAGVVIYARGGGRRESVFRGGPDHIPAGGKQARADRSLTRCWWPGPDWGRSRVDSMKQKTVAGYWVLGGRGGARRVAGAQLGSTKGRWAWAKKQDMDVARGRNTRTLGGCGFAAKKKPASGQMTEGRSMSRNLSGCMGDPIRGAMAVGHAVARLTRYWVMGVDGL